MGLAIRQSGQKRDLHLFDSFEGLPEPKQIDGAFAKEYSGGRDSGSLQPIDQCKAGLDDVRRLLLDRLRLPNTTFHVGWFENTVPKDAENLGPIALLRLDGDWYESTKVCMEHLYPKLSRGGILVIDDYYAWEGCQKAIDEYRAMHGIHFPIIRIDGAACYWVKRSPSSTP